MKPRRFIIPDKSYKTDDLAAGKSVSVSERIVPSTCTVLGYNVNGKSKLWKDLDWKSVWIDGKHGVRHMLDAGGAEYLHVSAAEECLYRVRPKLEIGDEVIVSVGKDKVGCVVESIEVHGFGGGFWHWIYMVKPQQNG